MMNEADIRTFLHYLGIRDSEIRTSNGWVGCCCPLAPLTHEHGRDSHPSFWISIHDDCESWYYCFGCTTEAETLKSLLFRYWLASGYYPHEAARFFVQNERFDGESDPDEQRFPTLARQAGKQWQADAINARSHLDPIPEDLVAQMPLLLEAIGYEARICRKWLIRERHITEDQIRAFQIRFYPSRGTILFPFTLLDPRPYMLRARSPQGKRIFTVNNVMLDYPSPFPSKKDVGMWFGLHLVDWARPVYLVEGEIDALRLASLGVMNAIASGGSKVTAAQLSQIHSCRTFLGFDADKEGQRATIKAVHHLHKSTTLIKLDWAHASCKDPGDLQDKFQFDEVVSAGKFVKHS